VEFLKNQRNTQTLVKFKGSFAWGPPGTGKTLLAKRLQGLGAIFSLYRRLLLGKFVGVVASRVRDFKQTKENHLLFYR
jgi:AAA+ superfamily predicted ATPase